MKLIMSDISVPISPSEMDRKLLLDTLDNMDVVRSGGKVVQGLVNRRSREKDNAEDINPAFPTDISEDADLSQIQKRAALNLLIREESSGGQNLGLESAGNTVGRYHIQQNKAALINPEIKDMTTTEYHRYILNNPEAEEELVSKYIDTEINKMLKNKGVDTSRLKHNEYASIVSNLYNKGNQPKLLDSAAKLTNFRKNNPREKRFTEKPYFQEIKGTNQNINQPAPIADTGEDIPLPENKSKFPKERVIDLPPEEENKYKDVPFLRYKPVQKLLGLAEGGAVPMKEQMSMFEDGGLMDEGGTVDPVSGNDVPPGSTQEEVRDDIPAQLSEGEFVFPADVVRFIGLGNLMRMRQEAKMGLKMMDEMGQMGNSEEATIPDDLPFDINDLDMEDEDEYNTPQEFAVGGMPTPNPNTGVFYSPAPTAPTTGVAAAPTQAASQQFVQPMRPQQAAVPTAPVYTPAEVPTFKGFVGENIPGVDFEYVEYTNEAGNVIKLRKSKTTGELLDPVPEGYTFVDPEATKTEEVATTPTTPQTTSVREDNNNSPEERAARIADKQRIKNRKDLSKLFGITEVEGVFEGIGGTFGKYGEDSIGKTTGTGYIIGKGGQLLDPLTGTLVRGGDTSVNPLNLISSISDPRYKNQTAFGKNFMDALPDNIKKDRDFYEKVQDQITELGSKAIQEEFENAIKNTDDNDARKIAKQIKDIKDEQAKKGNIDSKGNVINPSELPGARKSGEGQDTAAQRAADKKAADEAALNAGDKTGGYAQSGGDGNPGGGSSYSGDRDYGGGYGGEGNRGGGSSYSSESDRGRAKGGLINRPKPKAKKKMKKGGLASKK